MPLPPRPGDEGGVAAQHGVTGWYIASLPWESLLLHSVEVRITDLHTCQ